ncbi:ribonuclease H-like domain-containing protein [Tanacetum coccineum]
MNLKFLRSLSSEWKTHTFIWRNEPDLDTLSMDDLYNNLNVYETKVKGPQLIDRTLKPIDADDMEEIDHKVADDGLGYDWSDQAEEGPTNFTLMAFTSSSSSSSSSSDSEVSTFSKACLKSYETLKEHFDNLTKDFNKSQLNVGAYKAGIEYVEARLDMYKKNEVLFEENKKILKLDIKLRDNALTELRKKFENAEKQRDDLKLTLEKFGNSSKNLSKLLEIQVSDKFKTGVGFDSQMVDSHVFDSQENERYKTNEEYRVVPPPYTGNFMPPKYDLILADEGEYVFNRISDSEDENKTEFKSKQRKPSFAKTEFVKSNEHVKTPRESVKKIENKKQAKYPRKNSQSPRGNQRNWNNLMTQKLGSNFEFKNKACYECGSFNHLIKDCDLYEKKMVEKTVWNNARRANHQNSQRMTHPHPKGNFVPKAVLMKSGIKSLNTAGQNFSKAAVSVNTARPINTAYTRPTVNSARKASNVLNKAHTHVRRPFNKSTTNKNSNLKEKVNTVKGDVTTARPKAVNGNETGVINSGCSRHMTRNKSYLSDYKEIDGRFVAFGGDPKGVESQNSKDSPDARFKPSRDDEKKDAEDPRNKDSRVPSIEELRVNQEKDASVNNTNTINTVSLTVNTAGIKDNAVDENIVYGCDDDPNMPELEEIFYSDDDEDVGAEADINNLDTYIPVSPIPTTRIHKDHPVEQIIRDIYSAPKTRRMTKSVTEQAMFSSVQ